MFRDGIRRQDCDPECDPTSTPRGPGVLQARRPAPRTGLLLVKHGVRDLLEPRTRHLKHRREKS